MISNPKIKKMADNNFNLYQSFKISHEVYIENVIFIGRLIEEVEIYV